MTVANTQHAMTCEIEHQSEGALLEELGRLLGEVKASARSACYTCCLHTQNVQRYLDTLSFWCCAAPLLVHSPEMLLQTASLT